MSRPFCLLVAVASLVLGSSASAAWAVPNHKLGPLLGTLWQRALETPAFENPFAGNGSPCFDLGGRTTGALAPFGVETVRCTVSTGTKILVTVYSSECSTLEDAPYFGSDEAELRSCSRAADAGITAVSLSVDGERVAVEEAESALLHLNLP